MAHAQVKIFINHVSYAINDKPLFQSLSLTLGQKKTGLVGRNGIGKSTLIQLLIGETKPDTGSIQIVGTVAFCPQHITFKDEDCVADVLNIQSKLHAVVRIQQGSIAEEDFAIVGDDWSIEEHYQQQLAEFGLAHLNFDQRIASLSGGERTRLSLVKTFMTNADYLILDEPTNNLDLSARRLLYDKIRNWDKGLLIVSHDRVLLSLMEQIIELNSLGLNSYGGNYDAYHEQKTLRQEADKQLFYYAKKQLHVTQKSIQATKEKHAQRQAKGEKLRRTTSQAKIILDKMRDSSTKSLGELSTRHEHMLKKSQADLYTAKEKIEVLKEIHITLPQTQLPRGKIILDIENLCFSYQPKQIIRSFHFKMRGGERIALVGDNGSGKTTLIKLILGELAPDQGKIYLGTERIGYLHQHANTLLPELSVLDNFLRLNHETNMGDAHTALAKFLFRNTDALKLIKHLSAGEKLRAELACALMSKQPPQLLILDEPTNHLDIDSVTSIESALNIYQGCMIVISHDERFLSNIGIEKFIHTFYGDMLL